MKEPADGLYEKIDKKFYNDQKKSKNPIRKWFHVNRYRIVNSLVKSKYENGKKIIDLGTGSCDWNLQKLPVFGVDLNKGLMSIGKRKNYLYDFKIADATNTGLPSGSFDIVTMFEFLEHLTNYEKVIQESHRLLKDGGYCIASVPYDTFFSLWRPLFFIQVLFQGYILQNSYYKQKCGHINHFSPKTIMKAFQDQNYEIELIFNMRRLTIFICARKKCGYRIVEKPYKDISIILPTLNEGKNISNVLKDILSNYKDCKIIVVDDGSQDKTKEKVLAFKNSDLTFIDRSNKDVHGLTASILDAIDFVKTEFFVVMDADGQHPVHKIKEIINILRLGSRVVVASRVGVEKQWSIFRKILSYTGTLIGKISLLIKKKNYINYDILGGYFGCDTRFWKKYVSKKKKKKYFRPKGYKILFDFLKCLPCKLKIEEVYYVFATRKADVSKINVKIYLEFLKSCFLP